MKNSIDSTKLTRTLLLAILAIKGAVFVTTATLPHTAAWDNEGGGGTITPAPATFTNYEVAGNPFHHNNPDFSVGTTCPNTSRTCQNTEGEPAIRADRSGNFYGSSENVFCVIGGQCGGTFAWKSADGGAHFTTLPLPDSVSSGKLPPTCTDACNGIGLSPAGGDTDIAVAPRKNNNGFYNIYVASLQSTPPLVNVYVSTSSNGGATWSINPAGASIPVDDREWIAADGVSKVCISYHSTLTSNDIVVDCSNNAGFTFTQHASAFDPTHIAFLAGFNNVIGNMAIDPSNHVIYQVFSSIADAAELSSCLVSCHVHTVCIGVSTDGGNTFKDYTVYNNPNDQVDYGHQFINVSVDRETTCTLSIVTTTTSTTVSPKPSAKPGLDPTPSINHRRTQQSFPGAQREPQAVSTSSGTAQTITALSTLTTIPPKRRGRSTSARTSKPPHPIVHGPRSQPRE